MMKFSLRSTSLRALGRAIDKASAELGKQQLNAIKTEAFSLRWTLIQAIRMSAPAPGKRLKELSMIARTVNRRTGLRTFRPLLRLSGGVTYMVDEQAATVAVGFTKRSPKWTIRAAERQQAGFTRPITQRMREYIVSRGAERRANRLRRSRRLGNPLMLKKTTTRFVIPPRPIVAPFWGAERDKSAVRIRRNFRLISRGLVAPGGVLYGIEEMARW